MNLEELKEHFAIKSKMTLYRMCKELNIVPQNVTKWKQQGYIPLLQQYRIAELTDGKLMPDEIDPKTLRKQKRENNER